MSKRCPRGVLDVFQQLRSLQLPWQRTLANLPPCPQAASGGAASAGVVRYHRTARMRVRDLLGYDDVQTNVVYVLNMVYLLVQSIMVSFETLSFYSAGKALACAAHGIFAVTYFMEICVLCDCAHRASALVPGTACRTHRRVRATKTYLCGDCFTDRPLLPGYVVREGPVR